MSTKSRRYFAQCPFSELLMMKTIIVILQKRQPRIRIARMREAFQLTRRRCFSVT